MAPACASSGSHDDNAGGGPASAAGKAGVGAALGGQSGVDVAGQTSGGAGALGSSAGRDPVGGSSDLPGGGALGIAGDRNAGGDAGAAGAPVAGGPSAGSSNGGAHPTPALNKDAEVVLSKSGVTIVSFGGYLNGESFQQEGIITFAGYQYAAWWNTARHVVLARRGLPSGAWSALEFTDYTNTESDAHNTISIGICAADGTIHLAFDHHVSTLHYRKSIAGVASSPSPATWSPSNFSAVSDQLLPGSSVTQLTYPKFVSEPGATKMLFEARIGSSGSGDQYLWEYDGPSHSWSALGRYIYGTLDSINAYPHGLVYSRGGSRLHTTWCWRETPDAQTNHDLLYIYSDDNGRTWMNDAGTTIATTGSKPVTKASVGLKVWTINQNRGLINSEHMALDSAGRVHVLLSHMPDAQADDANFDNSRTKSLFFHYLRAASGGWSRSALNLPVVASFRGKLAVASSDNVYAILPDLRIAASSAASNYGTWAVLNSVDSGRFFSDPLIDSERLLLEDKLSIFYPQKSSANIYVLDYTVH